LYSCVDPLLHSEKSTKSVYKNVSRASTNAFSMAGNGYFALFMIAFDAKSVPSVGRRGNLLWIVNV